MAEDLLGAFVFDKKNYPEEGILIRYGPRTLLEV
jgi:hypothetical protein